MLTNKFFETMSGSILNLQQTLSFRIEFRETKRGDQYYSYVKTIDGIEHDLIEISNCWQFEGDIKKLTFKQCQRYLLITVGILSYEKFCTISYSRLLRMADEEFNQFITDKKEDTDEAGT